MSSLYSPDYTPKVDDMAKEHMRDAFATEAARGAFMQAVKNTMASFKCPTHDFHHLVRVTNLAMLLAARSRQKGTAVAGAVVEVAALCHDICDSKLVHGYKEDKVEALRVLLNAHTTFTPTTCDAIVGIVTNIGYKHMINDQHVLPSYLQKGGALHMEYLCVQDADLLDAIGAVGVARCMAFSGKKNRPLVNPMAGPNFHDDLDAAVYAAQQNVGEDCALSHFFEKLFRIPALLRTTAGVAEGAKRHANMMDFVKACREETDLAIGSGDSAGSGGHVSPFSEEDMTAYTADWHKLDSNIADVDADTASRKRLRDSS